jgi:hypothetical protein
MRVVQDALSEASQTYWLRRAAEFAAVGTAIADETAQACRNKATLAPLEDWPEYLEVLADRDVHRGIDHSEVAHDVA